MISIPQYLPAPGKKARRGLLITARAKGLVQFVETLGQGGVKIISVGRIAQAESVPGADVVELEIQVERPQTVVQDIRREERIAVVFSDLDDSYPEVLALRTDFPSVPHLNQRDVEFPKSLCLYEQPWDHVRLDWTPSRLLGRIRFWLAKTATGDLHAEDQPLEPLLFQSTVRLIVPPDFLQKVDENSSDLFQVVRASNTETEAILVAQSGHGVSKQTEYLGVMFECQPQTHGIIKHSPHNLQELDGFCRAAGLDLALALAAKIKRWMVEKPNPEFLKCRLLLVLLLPKRRRNSGNAESVEQCAYLFSKSIQEVGYALDAIQKAGSTSGYVMAAPVINNEKIAALPLLPVRLAYELSRERAAFLNNSIADHRSIVAIGMGALGSQIYNNLLRSGFGKWTLVDSDVFLPHNGARHYLPAAASGHNKADTMAEIGRQIFRISNGDSVAQAINTDVLKPGSRSKELAIRFESAAVVCDFSASLPVSRFLASSSVKGRHITAFMTPSGKGLVVGIEDSERKIRLDWLEMLHYRSVLNEPTLGGTLASAEERFRYGNSCRDISFRLAQDDCAIWSGVASKVIKQFLEDKNAQLRIYQSDDVSQISSINPRITRCFERMVGQWTIRIDEWIIEKAAGFRTERLPKETGGILLGHFDTQRKICFIVDILPSPPDSQEWPVCYIRGCAGLLGKVQAVEVMTLGQISYVGEWHSHPKNVSVSPSQLDYRAFEWLESKMGTETLPAIMMIVGDKQKVHFVGQRK
ncbi:MAG: ThiF family protein [Verrucomicrobiales bacterium]|nr:ThiF family protein [Verrucomicrobiales bacterium]